MNPAKVTPRQREIWKAFAEGGTAKEVAVKTGITPSTASSVNRELHRRLKVRNAPELTLAAIAHGVIDAPKRIS